MITKPITNRYRFRRVAFPCQTSDIDGKIFKAYKFSTMIDNAEKRGKELREDDPRITHIGKYLRWRNR